MADKDSSQRRFPRQERPLYQAGPKNEQKSKLTQSRDTSASRVSVKLASSPAPTEHTEKFDPMEAVERKLAEMSLRGPPGYYSRSAGGKRNNSNGRPFNNNNYNNNNHFDNNYRNNNNNHHHSNDFQRHQSTDSLSSQGGGRFNSNHNSNDNWTSRSSNDSRNNERHFATGNAGYGDRGSRDNGRHSFHGDNRRNTQYESNDRRENHDGHRDYSDARLNSERFEEMSSRNSDYQDRNNRQTNWRNVPRQNDGGSWRRTPNQQQGDFHRGFKDNNNRRRLNDSRDSLHSISSARSNDSRIKRGSPTDYQQNNGQTDRGKNENPRNGGNERRSPFEGGDSHGTNSRTNSPNQRPRRDRRRRSNSRGKRSFKQEQQNEEHVSDAPHNLPQDKPEERPEQNSNERLENVDDGAESKSVAGETSSSDPTRGTEVVDAEVSDITETIPEKPTRIDWTECPTPPPLEEETFTRPQLVPEPEPVYEPPEVEVRVTALPEESWRSSRSRQTSESSSGKASSSSNFKQWERQRDNRSQRGGRYSPQRDDSNFSSFHRRAQSPGARYHDSDDRRSYGDNRYNGSYHGKRYTTFKDSLPPRFRKQKENQV